jgi:hypothetical protein
MKIISTTIILFKDSPKEGIGLCAVTLHAFRTFGPSNILTVFKYKIQTENLDRQILIKRSRYDRLQCSYFSPNALNPNPKRRECSHKYGDGNLQDQDI